VLQYDFDESVGYWVAITSHTLRRALDAELARQKITFRQWQVLAWIALTGEPSQVELAERMGIEAPTLAGILGRMERDGWLIRHSCPHDRRRKRIQATAKAESVWTQMVECCRRVRARATDGISDEDLQTFKATCARIRQNLGVSDERGTPECPQLMASQTAAEIVFQS
jgi:MarR family transcriptional regulator for hemolysin